MQPYRVWVFSDLIEKNKRVFKVPVYQRNYDWSNIQCEKLYQDIMKANERDHKHFTGTVVYIVGLDGSNLNEALIIDGQQRITTVYILLKALYDAEKDFMGLTTFVGNQPTLKEAIIAKNYLSEKELRAMGQLVSGYLDFAERQAEREQKMTMKDWAEHLDRILTMSGEQLLQGNGSISHKQAIDKATDEYKKYKAKTFSDVEEDYLNSIKMLEKKTDKK